MLLEPESPIQKRLLKGLERVRLKAAAYRRQSIRKFDWINISDPLALWAEKLDYTLPPELFELSYTPGISRDWGSQPAPVWKHQAHFLMQQIRMQSRESA